MSSGVSRPLFYLSTLAQKYFKSPTYSGSLWKLLSAFTMYPAPERDEGININILSNNSVQLNFVDRGNNVWSVMPTVMELLSPNVHRGLVLCSYPLSGQYDHLPRVLFYCAAIFAVLGRHRTWVAEAALGIVIAYSATAAVHFFVLLSLYDFGMPRAQGANYPGNINDSTAFGDVDFFGIAPVVTLSVVLLTPMLAWSKTFRSHSSKVIIQCWALLMFAAAIALVSLIRGYGPKWTFNMLWSAAICKNTANECRPAYDARGNPQYDLKAVWDKCDCTDLCALLAPESPLREGTSMVPMLQYSLTTTIVNLLSETAGSVTEVESALFCLWLFAIIQGLIAFLGSSSSHSTIRNRIFKFLYGDMYTVVGFFFKGEHRSRILKRYNIKSPDKTTAYWRARCFFAKTVAASFYLFRFIGLVFYPIVFILTLAFCEFMVSIMPVSEPSSALGAWSSWVGAGFIIISAIIMALYPRLCGVLDRLADWIRYDGADRPNPRSTQSTTNKLYGGFADLKRHIAFTIRIFFGKQRLSRRKFVAWWKDPVKYSYPEKHSLDNDTLDAPSCRCLRCNNLKRTTSWSGDHQPDAEWNVTPLKSEKPSEKSNEV